MLLWSLVVTNTTKAEVGAFVDDRFAWSTADPANISSDMREVDAITRRFDATFGFQPNHSKYQVVGSTDEAKEAMQGIIEDVDVGEHMELLGLEYVMTRGGRSSRRVLGGSESSRNAVRGGGCCGPRRCLRYHGLALSARPFRA